VEDDRFAVGCKGNPYGGHIITVEGMDGRLAVSARYLLSDRGSIEKPLHIRKEGDEFLVPSLLKLRRLRAEVIHHPAPAIPGGDLLQLEPVFLNLFAGSQREQLNGPDDSLAEVPDHSRPTPPKAPAFYAIARNPTGHTTRILRTGHHGRNPRRRWS